MHQSQAIYEIDIQVAFDRILQVSATILKRTRVALFEISGERLDCLAKSLRILKSQVNLQRINHLLSTYDLRSVFICPFSG